MNIESPQISALSEQELRKLRALVTFWIDKKQGVTHTYLTEDQAIFYGVLVEVLRKKKRLAVPKEELYTRRPSVRGFDQIEFNVAFDNVSEFITSNCDSRSSAELIGSYRAVTNAAFEFLKEESFLLASDIRLRRVKAKIKQFKRISISNVSREMLDILENQIRNPVNSSVYSIGISRLVRSLIDVETVMSHMFPSYLGNGLIHVVLQPTKKIRRRILQKG